MTTPPNRLYYGDNLHILRNREYFPNACVDLIYLDPPFNSNRNYNVLFRDESGADSEAQITAFEDTWHWGREAEETYHHLVTEGEARVSAAIGALRTIVGTNQMMAYLVMMAARLVELHRVLKPTGSLYLHCDPTASHYLKVILDTIFGAERFVNEIIWKRSDAHNDAKQGAKHYGRIHDVILYYTKEKTSIFNALYKPLPDSTIESWYRHVEPETGRRYNKADVTGPGGAAKGNPMYEWKGITRYWRYSKVRMQQLENEGRLVYSKSGMVYQKRYLDESKGIAIQDLWDDIEMLRGLQGNNERLGYPTQKPLALLERIIAASSNPGDIVLDPFCGCGTAIAAAEKLSRRWVGIDITHLSIALQKYRLRDMFPDATFEVIGEPRDLGAARQLANDDRYQFQWWALSLVRAKPLGGAEGSTRGKKGADRGVDGVITFMEPGGKPARVIVQVKSGKVKSGDIRDLKGTVEREKAAIGVFITLEVPTREMTTEALSAGYYEPTGLASGTRFPRLQILSIEALLDGATVQMPMSFVTFKQAERVKVTDEADQPKLL
jgi:DNA modification methylase